MRYLVVIPPHRVAKRPHHRQLESERRLAEGDEIVLDELVMRVASVIEGRTPDGHDATVICAPAQPAPNGDGAQLR
jgi:hypothetical protein